MTDEPAGPLSTAAELAKSPEAQAAMQWMFTDPPLHALLGFKLLEHGPDGVEIEMPVREQAFNSTGNLHGGSLATLIDVTAGTAAALGSGFRPGEQTIVTADLHVRYLGRPKGEWVRASARVIKAGRQLVVVECHVRDPEGRIIAVADFSSMIVPLRDPLKPLPNAKRDDPDL